MTNIEQSGGRNRRRHMHSGLAGVRPGAIELGSSTPPIETRKIYTVVDQIANRMVVTETHQPSMHKPKNNWTR